MISIRKNFIAAFITFVTCSITSIYAMDNGKPLIHATPTGNGLTIQLDSEYEFPCTHVKRSEMIKAVMNNPETILQGNEEIIHTLSTDKQFSIKPEDFYALSLSNPVWSLSECTGYCSLNRLKNPDARKSFETIALQHINTHYPNKEKLLVYTSFACGDLFPDFVILTKLIESGYKNITINFIDTHFDEYIKIIQDNSMLDIKHPVKDNFFDQQNHKESCYFRLLTYRFTHMLSWLKTYGNIDFTLHIYPTMTAYQQDCLKNEALKANILFAIDWLDDFSANESTSLDLHYTGMFKILTDNGLWCSCKDSNRSFSSKNLFSFWLIKESRELVSVDISFATDPHAVEKYTDALKKYCTELKTDILI